MAKLVWKCDHCSDTNWHKKIIEEHELKCPFNPVLKYCYTCKHEYEAGYPMSGHIAGCEIKLNASEGEENGNCNGWETENKSNG